jgi:integrase/recombinase XerD
LSKGVVVEKVRLPKLFREPGLMPRWVEPFFASLSARGVKESTLTLIRQVVDSIVRKWRLDLEACSLTDLLSSLSQMQRTYSADYYLTVTIRVKQILRFIERADLAEKIQLPPKPDRSKYVESKILTRKDRQALFMKAPTPTDRLIVELLDETGGRRGEIVSAKVKSVQFDQYGAILTLTGKTGTRKRRIYASVPDLRKHLNDHPHKDNPEAPLFLNYRGDPMQSDVLQYRIHQLGKKVLKRRIHAHMFRHTRATEDSRLFTDREMMLLFGWRSSSSVNIYSHLSMRDVEDKDLVLHGMKAKEEILRPITQVQVCVECQEQNAPISVYCSKCGAVLANSQPEKIQSLSKENQELRSDLDRVSQDLAALKGQFETAFKTKITDTT